MIATMQLWLKSARPLLMVLLIVAGALLTTAPDALAATCSDFTTQAAAQAAANTRDGDGIYCERPALPVLD